MVTIAHTTPVAETAATTRRSITILGSTGSIGVSTLDVVARHPERFRVHALTGRTRLAALADQCVRFAPERAVVDAADDVDALVALLAPHRSSHRALASMQIDHGPAALCDVAREADLVMAAIVGAAGLPAAMAAVEAGRGLLLANKEALVMAGPLFMDAVARNGAVLLPIDSEHNAIFQCLPVAEERRRGGIARILLTASGGPFRTMPVDAMAGVTPDQAVAHPNWSMGRKISVDSATMMNKGLEVIEAHWLFELPPERIDVVVHPQSVIHSMVEYVDGSVLAQLGNPDMRTPIAHALAYPERIVSGVAPLDLAKVGRLDFEKPDLERFPCLRLAYAALGSGGGAPAVLNAANEVAVAAFLDGRIGFMDIASIVEDALSAMPPSDVATFEDVTGVDRDARAFASRAVERRSSRRDRVPAYH